jgi:glycosyltransferase involved in cell wall biosynthesis
MKVAVVVPAYRVTEQILDVLKRIPKSVSHIIVVDDACPDGSGKLVKQKFKDARLQVIFHEQNQGVGGAVITGYRAALDTDAEIVVKLDGDGQMNPEDITRLVTPIEQGAADYCKGNRFDSLEDLESMPRVRIFGNAVLSLMSKASSGYWNVTDPTNGFTAIHRTVLSRVHLGKLRKRWFFESDLLFRLAIVRAVVLDIPLPARYANEVSNLKLRSVVGEFLWRHTVNYHKRIFYRYYLREWSIASIELPIGVAMMLWGGLSGIGYWIDSAAQNVPATTGQVMLSAVPLILGFQLVLAFLNYDIAAEPKRPRQLDFN